jgi:hypothetical protein
MSLLSLLRHAPRTVVLAAATATLSVGLATVAAAPASAVVPKTPKFGATIENLSPYQPQTKCTSKAQPGVVKFRALILATYKGTGDDGIVRGCKVGGTSEHKEGRAWDWAVSVKNPHQVAQVKTLFAWLFASDSAGHKYAMARRLGIMYIIWNKRIWGTYAASSGWRPYSCSGVTLCHQNHVHFSFSRPGAAGKTSYWTKVVVNVGGNPGNGDFGNGNGGNGNGGNGGSGGSGGTPTSHGGDGDGWHSDSPPSLPDAQLPQSVDVPTTDYVVTPYSLVAGHHYLVTVAGSYSFASVRTSWDDTDRTALLADAECLQDPQWDGGTGNGGTGNGGTVTTPWTTTPSFGGDWSDSLLDLSVDRSTTWTPTIDDGNGCNSTDHRYVLHLTPTRTAPLFLHVVAGDRTDGSGTLTVTVSRDGS